MTLTTYLAFVGTALIILLSPGPATMLATTHGMRFGWRKVWATGFGDISANFVQIVIAVTGLGIVLATSELAFNALKIVGVGYLIYLAIKLFRSSGPTLPTVTEVQMREQKSFRWRYGQGFIVSFTSPKAIAFYGALFPQFTTPDQALLPQFALLAATVATLDLICVMGYAVLADRAGTRLLAGGKGVLINRISGGALLFAAGLLALASREQIAVE
ncbi:LysE family translocator [Pseudahrensia aquimaris]|uniref:LysE family translocator n=1 Tax=Pseudahrensia aquimaris TaxID=744461 RepID=A0ABW3FI43_9HYPH